MRIAQFFLRTYFRLLSAVAPDLAAKKAALLFQRAQKRKFRAPERVFYAEHSAQPLSYRGGELPIFEWGNPNAPLILLVHGWNSNAGSMSGIGNRLVAEGYRVIAMDLPGHGLSEARYTNLLEMQRAMQALFDTLGDTPFSIVSHSFGSAVSSFALAESGVKADKLIFLTSPNRMEAVFEDYQQLIGLGKKAFTKLLNIVGHILRRPIQEATVTNFLKHAEYTSLLLIHDRSDKVIPFDYAVDIYANTERTRYLPIEQTGHYRMLWVEDVIDMVADELAGNLAPRYGNASLDYRNKRQH